MRYSNVMSNVIYFVTFVTVTLPKSLLTFSVFALSGVFRINVLILKESRQDKAFIGIDSPADSYHGIAKTRKISNVIKHC